MNEFNVEVVNEAGEGIQPQMRKTEAGELSLRIQYSRILFTDGLAIKKNGKAVEAIPYDSPVNLIVNKQTGNH